MATADSIFAEGINNNNDIDNDIPVHDDDIVTAINQTPGYPQSVEMVDKDIENADHHKNQRQSQLYLVDQVENNNNNKNKIITILVAVLIIYSVIISTIALIIALNNNSSTPSMTSCDCTLNSLAAKTDSSVFCDLIDICSDIKATNNPSMSPSKYTTSNPSVGPTKNPSSNPSLDPSSNPSSNPTMEPSLSPTIEPTLRPTMRPTHDYNSYENYIGDYKISAQNESHGYWLLCDASFLDSTDYPLLFANIGYSFGSFLSNGTELFALPNGTDYGIIAYFENDCPFGWREFSDMNGRFALSKGSYVNIAEDGRVEANNYSIGEFGGEIKHKIIVDEMPTHYHFQGGQNLDGGTQWNGRTQDGRCQCAGNNDFLYRNQGTSSVGSSIEHNNMPPYLTLNSCQKIQSHLTNLFIYSGVYQ